MWYVVIVIAQAVVSEPASGNQNAFINKALVAEFGFGEIGGENLCEDGVLTPRFGLDLLHGLGRGFDLGNLCTDTLHP